MIKNIFITLILLGFIAFGFWFLGKSDNSSATLGVSTKQSQGGDAQYIYSLLQRMRQINLDDSIFSNKVFKDLKDNTVSLSAQPIGRENPFAPINSAPIK